MQDLKLYSKKEKEKKSLQDLNILGQWRTQDLK